MRSKSSSWQAVLVQIEALPDAERTALFQEVERRNGGAVTRSTYESVTEILRNQAAELETLRPQLEAGSEALSEARGSKAGPKTTVMREWLVILAKARHERGEKYSEMLDIISKVAKKWKLRGYTTPRSLMNVVNGAVKSIPGFQSKLETMKDTLEQDARHQAAVAAAGALHAGKTAPRGVGCAANNWSARQ